MELVVYHVDLAVDMVDGLLDELFEAAAGVGGRVIFRENRLKLGGMSFL